jgi:hypothetical protein
MVRKTRGGHGLTIAYAVRTTAPLDIGLQTCRLRGTIPLDLE